MAHYANCENATGTATLAVLRLGFLQGRSNDLPHSYSWMVACGWRLIRTLHLLIRLWLNQTHD
jgi:hypothetical protein